MSVLLNEMFKGVVFLNVDNCQFLKLLSIDISQVFD